LIPCSPFGSALAAPPPEVPVGGVARDAAGAPLPAVEITLLDAGRLPVATIRTDAGGRFRFAAPGPGRYIVAVRPLAGGAWERVVTVPPEGMAELVLTAPADPFTERVVVTATPGVPGGEETRSQA